MAGIRIRNLPAAGPPLLTDVLPFDALGPDQTRKCTVAQILALFGEVIVRDNFGFAAVSPRIIVPTLIGDWVTRVAVMVDEVFTDPAAFIRVGTVGNPNLFFAAGAVDVTTLGTYDNPEIYIPGAETIRVIISPGASIRGHVNVFIRIAR